MEELLLSLPLYLGPDPEDKSFLHVAATEDRGLWNAFYGTVDGRVYNNFHASGPTPLKALEGLAENVHLLELF